MAVTHAGSTGRMPVLFIGHGNPMNAIERNGFSEAWERLGASLPRPRAILSISAHWYVPGSRVTAEKRPRTIHDFGGFPKELFAVQYPAPGAPELAKHVAHLLAPNAVVLDDSWGLDHGTWSVLMHLFPRADVPVVQLGMDETLSAEAHYGLARKLQRLREEGVLILGSGNVVHNLHAYAWGRHPVEPYDWGLRFEKGLRERIVDHEHQGIVDYEALGRDAALSAPTPEHFLPLLYVLANAERDEPIAFPVEGYDGGSVSMMSVRIG